LDHFWHLTCSPLFFFFHLSEKWGTASFSFRLKKNYRLKSFYKVCHFSKYFSASSVRLEGPGPCRLEDLWLLVKWTIWLLNAYTTRCALKHGGAPPIFYASTLSEFVYSSLFHRHHLASIFLCQMINEEFWNMNSNNNKKSETWKGKKQKWS
jgi:hypothetical protein